MKKFRNVIAVLLVLAISASGAAWAADEYKHVKIAPNAKGDLLFYPFYAAFGDWETTIEVINTSNTYSAVAKLVVRSMIDSQECRDFLIYLTPNDVWKGQIMIAPTQMNDSDTGAVINAGDMIITSTDDSVLRRFPSGNNCSAVADDFASTDNPFVTEIGEPDCAGDTCRIGYVEIIEAWSIERAALAGAPATGPIPKPILFADYWPNGMEPCGAALAPLANITGVPEPLTGHYPRNILYGKQIFMAPAMGATPLNVNSAVNATVLRDYDNESALQISIETLLGEFADNTTGEVEAALSKNELAMQYENQSLSIHFLTFPTKLTRLAADGSCNVARHLGPYFRDMDPDLNRCFPYEPRDYNLQEATAGVSGGIVSPPVTGGGPAELCGEVNLRTGFGFEEGWSRYTFFNDPNMNTPAYTNIDQGGGIDSLRDDASYTGIPAVGTVLYLGENGYAHQDGYTPGNFYSAVDGPLGADGAAGTVDDGIEIEYYQYSDLESNVDLTDPTVFVPVWRTDTQGN